MATTSKQPIKPFDYKKSTDSILKNLRRDRDRQIIARRFGFDMPKRQTLGRIGEEFGITRERVRQIEKATLTKIKNSQIDEVREANQILTSLLRAEGGVALLSELAAKMGATTPDTQSYVLFLATLAPDIEVVDEDDKHQLAASTLPDYSSREVRGLTKSVVDAVATHGKPVPLDTIKPKVSAKLSDESLHNLAKVSKQLAHFDGHWGLTTWPEVNPKSIRDKTYLVLTKHQQPLHFADIADRIRNSSFSRRNVTVQAVHNELIKDPRFILIGRGIYALAEWGYTPGTVADIIVDVLREESPLHKDEIIKRVLDKRQVKTTTIILNLQEKDQFERVAKATYKLKGN
jgi:hypothetical protein